MRLLSAETLDNGDAVGDILSVSGAAGEYGWEGEGMRNG